MKNKWFYLSPGLIACLSALQLLLLMPPAAAASAKAYQPQAVTFFPPAESGAGELKTCRVTSPRGAKIYIEKTGKTVRLGKGTLLYLVDGRMHQGLIVVRVKQGNRFVVGDIDSEDTNCL